MTLKAKCTCPPWHDPDRDAHMPWCSLGMQVKTPYPPAPPEWRCTCNALVTATGVSYHTFACLWPAPTRPKDESMPTIPLRTTTMNELEITNEDLKRMLGAPPEAKIHFTYVTDENGQQVMGSLRCVWYVKHEDDSVHVREPVNVKKGQ